MRIDATVSAFDNEEEANRTVRWLRRSGLRARVERVGRGFEVVVPAGRQEERARSVLEALERAHTRSEPVQPTGWEWVRTRLLNLESVGMVISVVGLTVLSLAVGIWLWALSGMIGWLMVIVVLGAGLIYFHFSGMPHSAVKAPRRYSHKHDITMEEEQMVQYRLAWARDQWRRSRESRLSRFLRRRRKE